MRIFPNHKTRLFDAFNWQNLSQRAPYGQQQLEQALEETISQAYYNQLVQEQRAAALTAVRKALADMASISNYLQDSRLLIIASAFERATAHL